MISEEVDGDCYNNAVVIEFDDPELALACRTLIIRNLNRKNAVKVNPLSEKRCFIKRCGIDLTYLSQISELSQVQIWPKKMAESIVDTWLPNGKWPAKGVDNFGLDKDTTTTPIVCIWFNDAPKLSITAMDKNELVTEIFVKRYDHKSNSRINLVDERRSRNPQNFLGLSRTYLDLNEDLIRIDPSATVRCLPRHSSGIDDILELNANWDTIHQGKAKLREVDMSDICPVNGAVHCSRLPTGTIWRARDVGVRFMKLALSQANLMAVDFEPVARAQIRSYEKELCKIEEHILGGPNDAEKDEILAGFNVDQNGDRIIFKVVSGVRTEGTHIPLRNITEDEEDEKKVFTTPGRTIREVNEDEALKNFRFENTDKKIIKTEFEYVEEDSKGDVIKTEPCITHDNKLYSIISSVSDSDSKSTLPLTPKVSPKRKKDGALKSARASKKRRRETEDIDSEVTIDESELESSSSESEDDMEDLSDPDSTIKLMLRLKEARGTKITYSYQKEVKKLKRFNSKPLFRHAKKKLRLAAMMTNPEEVTLICPHNAKINVTKVKNITPKSGGDTEPVVKKMVTASKEQPQGSWGSWGLDGPNEDPKTPKKSCSKNPPKTPKSSMRPQLESLKAKLDASKAKEDNAKAAKKDAKAEKKDANAEDEFDKILTHYDHDFGSSEIKGLETVEADLANGNEPAKAKSDDTNFPDDKKDDNKIVPVGKSTNILCACLTVVLDSSGGGHPGLTPTTFRHLTPDLSFTGKVINNLELNVFMYFLINSLLLRLLHEPAAMILSQGSKATPTTCFYKPEMV